MGAAILLSLASPCGVAADPPASPAAPARPYDGPHVVLKGGIVLPGRVVGTVTLGGRPFSRIETHFGYVVARPGDVTSRDEAPPAGGVFHVSEVRMDEVRDEWVGDNLAVSEEMGPAWGERLPFLSLPGAGDYESPRRLLEQGVAMRFPARMSLRCGSKCTRDAVVRIHRGIGILPWNMGVVSILPPDCDATLSLRDGSMHLLIDSTFPGDSLFIRTPTVRIELATPGRYAIHADTSVGNLRVFQGRARIDGGLEVPEHGLGTWREEVRHPDPKLSTTPSAPGADFWPYGLQPFLPDDMCFVPTGRYRVGTRPGIPRTGSVAAAEPYVFGYAQESEAEVGAFLIDRREVSATEAKHFTWMHKKARAELATDHRPAHGLTMKEATAWALKAGKRLPTASQWEVAGRGDAAEPQPFTLDARSAGTWTGEEAGDVALVQDDGRIQWTPPALLAAVDAPTEDVSPFGVEALRSGVPELVRPNLQDDPVFTLLRRRRQADVLAGRTEYVRGIRGSLVALATYSPKLNPGFRCVIELTPR